MIRVSFVCLGNICRSPQAEGILRRLVADAGLEAEIAVESSGTSAYHEGELADARTRAASRRHGLELTGRSQPFAIADFDRCDYVIALDTSVLSHLQRLARGAQHRERLHLLRAFDPLADSHDVPDPYASGPEGFELVYQMCLSACRHLLERLRVDLGRR